MDTPPDSYYKGQPFNPSEDDIKNEGMLRNLTNRESLAVFLSTSAVNQEANGEYYLAAVLYNLALRLHPTPVLLAQRNRATRIAMSRRNPLK